MSKKICVFGDSIVQGLYDLEKGGWVNRLHIYSMENNKSFYVFNFALAGNVSGNLLKKIEEELILRRANVVVISVGINDAIIDNGEQRTDLKIFRKNLEKILKISKKFTSEIVFLGISNVNEKFSTPVGWGENICYYNKELKKYSSVIEKFCQEKKIIFIPMQGLLSDEETPDGVHPSAVGHEKIFQRVKTCLEKNEII